MGRITEVKVWDGPVRLFHWSLAALFAFSWWSGETGGNAMEWHLVSGYAILVLVLFRIVWGFIGSTTARFGHFLRGLGAMLDYAAGLLRRAPSRSVGHNPLAGIMVVLMLIGLLLQAASGLFANDDIVTEGPLAHLVGKSFSDQLTVFHTTLFDVLLALTAIHLAAVLFYRLVKQENLVRPMLTGHKAFPEGTPQLQPLRFVSLWRALAVLAACAGVVCALVKWA